MSFTYQGLKHERQWKATTGLKATQFYRLSKDFGEKFEDIFGESLSARQDRSSQESAFRSYEDLLFFLLFSLKSGLTYDALGAVFGIDGSSAKRIQELHLPILKATLHSLGHMPKREFASVLEFQQFFESEEELILDGTEQRIQKPKGYERQKPFYSGKKKRTR
jgi:hypothetical protein